MHETLFCHPQYCPVNQKTCVPITGTNERDYSVDSRHIKHTIGNKIFNWHFMPLIMDLFYPITFLVTHLCLIARCKDEKMCRNLTTVAALGRRAMMADHMGKRESNLFFKALN